MALERASLLVIPPLLLFCIVFSPLMAVPSIATEEAFVQCLHDNRIPSELIFAAANPSFASILGSTARNGRFLSSHVAAKPAVIVTPTDAAHVQISVLCCRSSNIGLRARSGGHDYEGMSYVDADDWHRPFVLFDLRRLSAITVDHVHGTAWVGAGATVGELYYAIAHDNRTAAFPAGTCPTMGIGGHFSGGGLGPLMRKYGTAADNIVDVKLVVGNGDVLGRGSMGEDRFWAIRGGGAASFGIVLAYKINLVAVPPTVTAFQVTKTLAENATQLVHRWQEIAPKFEDDLYVGVVVGTTPDDRGGRTITATFNSLYLGTCEALLVVMEKSFPELGFGAKYCKEMSWLETFLFFNGLTGRGVEALLDKTPTSGAFKAKSDFVTKPISRGGLEGVWKFLTDAKDEAPVMIMDPLGGRMDEIASSAIAFPHRKGNLYDIQYYIWWNEKDPTAATRHLEWMREWYAFMAPLVSSGPRAAYYNYKDIDLGRNSGGAAAVNYAEAAKGWGAAYFKGNFERLATVKGKYDGENFFRNGQTIPPLI